jgi:hypothetical protein
VEASSAAQVDRPLPCRSSDAAEVRANFEFSIETLEFRNSNTIRDLRSHNSLIALLKGVVLNLVSVLDPQAGSDNVRHQGSASNSSESGRGRDRYGGEIEILSRFLPILLNYAS